MNRTGTSPVRVLVIEEPGVRHGLVLRCAIEPDLDVVGSATDHREGIRLARELRPDVVVLGTRGAGDGLAAARHLSSSVPYVGVVLLGLHDDGGSRAAASDAGVVFVSKHDGDAALLRAVRRAASHNSQRAGSVVSDRSQHRS